VVVLTAGVDAMTADQRRSILRSIRAFDAFDEDNDPHGEHDFGAVEENDSKLFWKIDYFARAMELRSPDPADPSVTMRVLTVMLADEY
jgi:hypothetical protein